MSGVELGRTASAFMISVPQTVCVLCSFSLLWLGATPALGRSQVFIVHGSSQVRRLALTFDDGPSPYTRKILSVLQRHQAKATFFVLGCHA
ncbi:MAG: polysaccharide deacetylase family protein, partial [Deltaproteobacteria bacterium]|nr:polysaccharide deacetylase family protein [Deltaproteobacteria bacterium]